MMCNIWPHLIFLLSSLLMKHGILEEKLAHSFLELVEIVARLRNPQNGCPWDLEQTHTSLKPFIVEETYEVCEAIDDNPAALPYELGDVLLQVLLHAQIGSENERFTLQDIIDHLSKKLIYRHPHVFGNVEADSAAQVLKNWEQLKKQQLQKGESILDGVPKSMSALLRAQRIGEKAARVGFEWRHLEEIRDKVLEEVREFIDCSKDPLKEKNDLYEEFGDLLFALAQLARRMNVDSEDLLQKANNKFIRRFKQMERRTSKQLHEHSLEELNTIWEQIKVEERRG